MNNKRPPLLKRSLLIDHDLQIPLMFYTAAVAFSGMLVIGASAMGWAYAIHKGYGNSYSNAILLFGMVATVLVMFFFGLYFTNKVAGPLHRLRMLMEDAADGEEPQSIGPRDGDLVTEGLFNAYNRLIKKMQETHKKAS